MRPKIGVGVLVIQDGKVLLGERVGAHGSGTWSPPGGHLEFGETPLECAKRELEEETGLIAKDIEVGPYSNDIFHEEEKHYISLIMIVRDFEGTPEVTEPHKCLRWDWFELDNLPDPLFLTLINLRDTGFFTSAGCGQAVES